MNKKIDIIKSWLDGRLPPPFRIQFHLTSRCSLDCYFCWLHKENKHLNELSDKKWLKILDESAKLGVTRLTISGGGEPLLRPNLLLEIVKKSKALGMEGDLITNGTLIDSKYAKELVESEWDTIFFSLHGSNSKTDDFIRGVKGSFNKTIKAIKLINQWKERNNSETPLLGFIMVITRDNYDEIVTLVKLAEKLDIGKVTVRMVNENPKENVTDLFIKKENLSVLRSQVSSAKKITKKSEGDIDLNLEFNIEDIKERFDYTSKNSESYSNSFKCFIPFREMVIFANGEASQCCNFFNQEVEVVDDISNKTLEEVWYGERFEKLRNSIKTGNPPRRCDDCSIDLISQNRDLQNLLSSKK